MISIGIDVGGTNLRVGAVSSEGELLLSFREATPQNLPPKYLVEKIIELVGKVQQQISEPLVGLGLGWPGTVDYKLGSVLETPNIPGFKDFPLQSELEKALKLPCLIENDAKCAGLAENNFGAARDLHDFILLTFGTGIGGVIFSNSQLIRGRAGLAGEIGHLCLHPGGHPCFCGGKGCFEQYVSAKALERRASAKIGREVTAREVLELAEKDERVKICLNEYVSDLATGLDSLINIFNPEALIFSGGLFTTGGAIIIEVLKSHLAKKGFQSMKKDVQLLASTLEGKAGIIGAANLMFPAAHDPMRPPR